MRKIATIEAKGSSGTPAVSKVLPAKSLTLMRSPCVHEGVVIAPCSSCRGEARHIRDCSVHGSCTREPAGKDVEAVCSTCPDYKAINRKPAQVALPPFAEPLTWVSTAQLTKDSVALAALAPIDCSGVVAVPRSGVLPAGVIATHLHLPLFVLGSNGPVPIIPGARGDTLAKGRGPLMVVDDTVYGGSAMTRARSLMGARPALYTAVYVRPESADTVDMYARPLPSPHILEWNFANNGPFSGFAANKIYGIGVAVDLDGVLIHDAESSAFGGGPIGSPYLVPRARPVKLIVTGRREQHRGQTESLLHKLGVRWDRLEMYPDTAPEAKEAIASHKAKHFAKSGCGLFVESCPVQAELIYRETNLPVVCPIVNKVWQNGTTS